MAGERAKHRHLYEVEFCPGETNGSIPVGKDLRNAGVQDERDARAKATNRHGGNQLI